MWNPSYEPRRVNQMKTQFRPRSSFPSAFFKITASCAVLATGLLIGCGQNSSSSAPAISPAAPPAVTPPAAQAGPFVSKSITTLTISTDNFTGVSVMAVPPKTIPISVINAPNSSMVVDSTAFVVPAVANAVLNFGTIKVTSLVDNNLNVCGASGTAACTNAVIRIYTTGAGPGIFNAVGGYGMPIAAKVGTTALQNIGLTAANAAIVQTHAIPATQHAIHLSDFSLTPVYAISSDFTNAGAGTYSTTLVIEYGLN
jgi:hypothetical protein